MTDDETKAEIAKQVAAAMVDTHSELATMDSNMAGLLQARTAAGTLVLFVKSAAGFVATSDINVRIRLQCLDGNVCTGDITLS